MELQLKPGDVFCTRNNMLFGRCINSIQRFFSYDDNSTYSHSGIILNKEGDTFESKWFVGEYNLFEQYIGREVLIARCSRLSKKKFENSIEIIKEKYNKQFYPVWRLIFFLIPPTAKYINFGKVICSELVAHYLHLIGFRYPQYYGTDVDKLSDEFNHWRTYKVIHKGILEIPEVPQDPVN